VKSEGQKKSETRNPKSERNPRPEARKPEDRTATVRNSDFGLLSVLGFRISDLVMVYGQRFLVSSHSFVVKPNGHGYEI